MSRISARTSVIAILLLITMLLPSALVGAAGERTGSGNTFTLQSDWGSTSPLLAKNGKHVNGKHSNGHGKDKGKGHGKKDDNDKPGKPGKGPKGGHGNQKVAPIASNAVAVSCNTDEQAANSTCTFTATGPNGPSKIKVLYVPEAVVCNAVIETTGSGAAVDDDPAFASRKNKPDLSIMLTGTVTTGGSATYWVEAGKRLVPVKGQGLVCSDAAKAAAPVSPTPDTSADQSTAVPTVAATATPAAAVGAIEIRARACATAMTDPDVDWFRLCPDGAAGLQFHLAPVEGTGTGVTAITDQDGTVTFGNLQPGTYKLNLVDLDWCHAESDSVDADGNLVVAADGTVTVWIFTCAGS